MLEIDQLTRPGLAPVRLTIADGDCVAVRGPSGAGKSLLLRAIADLDPNSGAVSLDGRRRDDFAAPDWRRRVTYVPAESGWWADRVGEHFEAPEIAAGYLLRLGFHGDVMAWPVSRLSTGERQRLALLRALVLDPRVMLLDEPTSALDPEATAKVESVLHEKLGAGVGILMVTHDKAQARRLATVRYTIHAGRLAPEAEAGP